MENLRTVLDIEEIGSVSVLQEAGNLSLFALGIARRRKHGALRSDRLILSTINNRENTATLVSFSFQNISKDRRSRDGLDW